MTNAELNFRLQVCAEAGMPYSDKLWGMLAAAWDRGRKSTDPRNPFRQTGEAPTGPTLGDVDPF